MWDPCLCSWAQLCPHTCLPVGLMCCASREGCHRLQSRLSRLRTLSGHCRPAGDPLESGDFALFLLPLLPFLLLFIECTSFYEVFIKIDCGIIYFMVINLRIKGTKSLILLPFLYNILSPTCYK